MSDSNVYDELDWRGVVFDATPEVRDLLGSQKISLYCGFDPTADSLHVGSLMPVMGLARMQRFGHRPVALVGGGTGLIGDPSGKSQERTLLTREQVEANLEGIRSQLERFLDFGAGEASAVIDNNARWLCEMSAVDFMRDTGKYFTVNYMLAKESVKRRLATEDGLSYTEFSYMLLQAHDFLVLHDEYNCVLQIGGSDQWGNILSGTDLIRRVRSKRTHGLVFPLVTSSTGAKFGKTESGTVWLDAERTSPYKFYQFWLNTDDRDVVKYLKYFTWLNREEIDGLASELESNPGARQAHRRLAEEVTRQVHGDTELHRAIQASQILFGGDMSQLSLRDVMEIFEDVPSNDLERDRFEGDGISIVDLLDEVGVVSSKGEARRLLKGGGVRLNNNPIDENKLVRTSDAIDERLLVLRKGKKNYHLVEIR